MISLSKHDWDSYETSWDFTELTILRNEFRFQSLEDSYAALSEHWKEQTLEMKQLEEENNRIFIEAYGLEDELTPEVPLNEITLTCNPHYRYKGDKSEKELEALGKDIRRYFLTNFYTDHVKRYKKRPIYWMFSSPKGSFNALIYMHRYRPDTVSVVLNDYLREFRSKLEAHKDRLRALGVSANASQSEKTKALKDVEKVNKQIAEIDEYERDVLYPLATKRFEIDRDDGVKANYPKFGKALKKVTGLSG